MPEVSLPFLHVLNVLHVVLLSIPIIILLLFIFTSSPFSSCLVSWSLDMRPTMYKHQGRHKRQGEHVLKGLERHQMNHLTWVNFALTKQQRAKGNKTAIFSQDATQQEESNQRGRQTHEIRNPSCNPSCNLSCWRVDEQRGKTGWSKTCKQGIERRKNQQKTLTGSMIKPFAKQQIQHAAIKKHCRTK